MLLSKGKSPTKKTMTRGYMNTLWYQHKAQGGKSIISLKNKLPKVETLAMTQHMKMIVQFEFDALSGVFIFANFPRRTMNLL
jgi:hypothetical protein